MAVTITLYNQTVKRLVNQEVTLAGIYAMLLNDTAIFDATDVDLQDVSGVADANQVSGFGWADGGELLANVAITAVTTNDAKLDADDITKTATGGSIGPAYKAVLYDTVDTPANGIPIAFIDFDGVREAGDTTDFVMRWHTNGIFTFTYT